MQITISNTPIEPDERPKNVYRLTMRFMHGDADYYDTHSESFEIIPEIIEFLSFLKDIPLYEPSWDNIKDSWVANVTRFEDMKNSDDYDWEDMIYEFWPSDITYSEIPAALDYWQLSWFNQDGIEFLCTVKD